MNEKRKKANKIGVVIILAVLILAAIGTVVILGEAKANENLGISNAHRIHETMIFHGNLPWNADEHSLIAVIVCDDHKIFVERERTFGSEILSCGYYTAMDVELVFGSENFSSQGTITFRKYVVPSE